MSRLNTNRMGGKQKQSRAQIRIRILRSWRGYGPGAIISPPAGARQILLSATDQLGRQIAEIVDDEAPAVADVATPVEVVAAVDEADDDPDPVRRGPGRPRKNP